MSLVAVFVPVAFMPGIVGQFFKQFGLTISAAVLISMFISFTLDPMLSARLSKQRMPGQHDKENPVARGLAPLLRGQRAGLRAALEVDDGAPHGRRPASPCCPGRIAPRRAHRWAADFLLPMDRTQFLVQLKLPEGASLAESHRARGRGRGAVEGASRRDRRVLGGGRGPRRRRRRRQHGAHASVDKEAGGTQQCRSSS